eukprot:GEMP01038787.1.p1 GENE.GEMP01038787.1~~GEMP01038787.1.p1  ORF type:complete len:221 (+),score=26.46 GEMP01038787.1:224-886(+)
MMTTAALSPRYQACYRPLTMGDYVSMTGERIWNASADFCSDFMAITKQWEHALSRRMKLFRSCTSVALGTEPRICCRFCYQNPASIVEIPCGHVTTCPGCSKHYCSPKCMVCGAFSTHARINISEGMSSGRPLECYMCKCHDASVLALPCEHLICCKSCFRPCHRGCPQCGQRVIERVEVLWQDAMTDKNYDDMAEDYMYTNMTYKGQPVAFLSKEDDRH